MTLERFWSNWLLWFLFLAGTGLGCLFLVALEHLVGARWSVPVRRTAERLSGLILLAAPVGLIALFSLPHLYPWTRPEAAANPFIAGKAAWLNIPFFAARSAACIGLWVLFQRLFAGASLRQDESKDPWITVRLRRLAPAFMIVFALTVTLAAFDWLSSLEPEWYSDIFGVYIFAGFFTAGLAAISLGVTLLKRSGRLPDIKFDHVYNLGALLFAFTVFWSYIGFAQYMLMWYANLPEEVFWYTRRLGGGWQAVTLLLAALHFFIPFFALIPRDAKGDLKRLARVSVIVLCAHFLDLYWLIFPVISERPLFSWPELLFAAVFITGGLAWAGRSMSKGKDMPVGDPFIKEGLSFRL